MKVFRDLTDDVEGFDEFKEREFDDDEKLKEYFEQCGHANFVSILMKVGTLLDTVSTYFGFLEPQVNQALKSESQIRNRKLNKFIKDLNEKINLDYGFEDEIIIVEDAVLFDDKVHLFINKCNFIKRLQLDEMNIL